MPSFKEQLDRLMTEVEVLPPIEQEPAIQRFFEENPQLITKGEFLNPNAVVSKLPIGTWTTDFAYINPKSGPHFIFLVEIESSSKRIFTQRDEFTADFNHAIQQVHDWLAWSSANKDFFRQLYNDAAIKFEQVDNGGMLSPRGILVYGRRAETQINPVRRDRWRQKKESETFVEIMTYDGLTERYPQAFIADQRGPYDPVCVSYGRRTFTEKAV